MGVQRITGKRITKYDTSNPNFVEKPKPEVKVSGNVQDDEEQVYQHQKHFLELVLTKFVFYE